MFKKSFPQIVTHILGKAFFRHTLNIIKSSFRQALLQSLVRFYNKACLCCSDQEKTLSEHLNFYLIFIMSRTSRILLFIFFNLQLTTRCCNTFDELLLEDQIQYDHRDTCKQRCCHQLRIIVGVLSLHFCKCC